jgi:thiol:disulfide interchange protein
LLKTGRSTADRNIVRHLRFKHRGVLATCAATLIGIALAVPATSADSADNPPPANTSGAATQTAAKIDKTLEQGPAVIVGRMPQGIVDDLALVEARAAATQTGAPFLSLSATEQDEAAELIQRFNVVTTPAILVVDSEQGVRTHINGYADRETVAQAVQNARR